MATKPDHSSNDDRDQVTQSDLESKSKSFESLSEQKDAGLVREFIDFLKNNKKWWLTPIILVLLLVGLMIGLTTSGAAPFLYTFW